MSLECGVSDAQLTRQVRRPFALKRVARNRQTTVMKFWRGQQKTDTERKHERESVKNLPYRRQLVKKMKKISAEPSSGRWDHRRRHQFVVLSSYTQLPTDQCRPYHETCLAPTAPSQIMSASKMYSLDGFPCAWPAVSGKFLGVF